MASEFSGGGLLNPKPSESDHFFLHDIFSLVHLGRDMWDFSSGLVAVLCLFSPNQRLWGGRDVLKLSTKLKEKHLSQGKKMWCTTSIVVQYWARYSAGVCPEILPAL